MLQNFRPDLHLILVLPAVLQDGRCMQFAVTACKVIIRVTNYLLQQNQELFEFFWQIGKG
jgi:hypothetical protein